jgi:hypothetical protein
MSWTEEKTQQTLAEIGRRAATDPAFRALALKDPSAAVQQVAGLGLPADFKLRFVENDGAHLTHVLPDAVDAGRLSDAELEGVSGGAGAPVTLITYPACSGAGKCT